MKMFAPFLTVVVLFGAAAPARPWGCEGHQTVALIAQNHLTPQAQQAVDELLAPYATDPQLQHACRATGIGMMAERSTWADDVRRDQHSPYFGTDAWHFIDIPLRASRGNVRRFCPRRTGCILSALTRELAVLRDATASPRRKAEALMFVIHLVGDLHQPLHCATNNDRGGNCLPVGYFGSVPHPEYPGADFYQPNLHAVWDALIIDRLLDHHGSGWLAHALDNRFAAQIDVWKLDPVDLDAWAWETHQVARETAYGRLPIAIPVAEPRAVHDCREVSSSMLRLHEQLGDAYQRATAPVVQEQLAKAGIRLAMVLNQLWP